MNSTAHLVSCVLFALSAPLHADVIYPLSPLANGSVHDQPADGIGDSVNTGMLSDLIAASAISEDRAVQEYDANIVIPSLFGGAYLNGRIEAMDLTDSGTRTFDIFIYVANGSVQASDFETPATWVGQVQYHPPMDTAVNYAFDVSSLVGSMLSAGQAMIGVRVEAADSSSPNNRLNSATASLDIAECSIGGQYCFGDGTGATCPCGASGAIGEGCSNTTGSGATFLASGIPSFSNDTLQFQINGVPGTKPGLILRGDSQVAFPVGDGILCVVGESQRSHVQLTSGGSDTFTHFNGSPFGSVANAGAPTNFQYWYRDPSNPCSGQGFNFSNAFTVTYTP